MSRLTQMLRKRQYLSPMRHSPPCANRIPPHPEADAAEPKTKVGRDVDEFEIRRPLQPTVGTAAEMYARPEQIAAVKEYLPELLEHSDTLHAVEHDLTPIPANENREGYGGDAHLSYWISGIADLHMVQRLAPAVSFTHVLDFGGASGRFARHVPLAFPSARVTIADININHVDWVHQHFDSSVRAVKVSALPHFPIADSNVTLCVGFSVFTHIDAYETGWLAEVHRVLVDDGYAVLTIHSEHTWSILPTKPAMLEAHKDDSAFMEAYRPNEPMPAERLVFRYPSTSSNYNCNVFTTCDYIRRVWGRWFEVVDIAPLAHHGWQTAVVLRKKK